MTIEELRERIDASAGRIARASPGDQLSVFDRELRQFDGSSRDFAASELGMLTRKLELERSDTSSSMTNSYYKNLGLGLVFVVIVFAIAHVVSKWTGGFLSAVGVSCGTLFFIALLPMVLTATSLSAFQREVLRMYLAVAAAGVGAGLPGFIEFSAKSSQTACSAGGALALFVLVYWKSPNWLAPEGD